MQKETAFTKTNLLIFLINLLITAISLFISLPLAEGLQDVAVDTFRDTGFAAYLATVTPEMFLFAFLYFVFDGVFSTLSFYHSHEKAHFLASRKSEVMLFPEVLHAIISFEFLAEAALCALACYRSPTFGFIHFALLLAVCVFRKASVRRKWYITRKAANTKKVFLVILKNMGVLILQIWLFIIFMPMVFPYIWILITQYEFFANIIALALIILFTCIYARAVKKRNDFIKKLRMLCSEKGFELSEIKNKYSFIFGRQSGANFTVTAHGKTYSCKFIAAKMKNIPVILKSHGEGNHIYTFSMRGIKLLDKRVYFEYGFEAAENERKILICSPMPAQMSVYESGRITPVTTGASFWEYKLFNASNFLRCLEWDAMEK